MKVIGLMSGTSFDAVDAAAAEVDLIGGEIRLQPLGMVSTEYPSEIVELLQSSLPPQQLTMAEVCRLDTRIGQVFGEVAAKADVELCGGDAELVTSHGQTVFHWIEDGHARGTLQLGQPAWIAEATGLPVVSDLRSRDVAAGGQGAPLVCLLDILWLRGLADELGGEPVALNLGGIANITAGVDGVAIGYDTGPANAWIDAFVTRESDGQERYDTGGARALRGRLDHRLLARLLAEPYYARPAPKTTGKELFSLAALDEVLAGLGGIDPDDVVTTLTELTAITVADAVRRQGASAVVASGGGTRNPILMQRLVDQLGSRVQVRTSDEFGLPSASKEALAFAVLGWLTVQHLPGSVPSVTGATVGSVLGSITPGRKPLAFSPAWASPQSLVIA